MNTTSTDGGGRRSRLLNAPPGNFVDGWALAIGTAAQQFLNPPGREFDVSNIRQYLSQDGNPRTRTGGSVSFVDKWFKKSGDGSLDAFVRFILASSPRHARVIVSVQRFTEASFQIPPPAKVPLLLLEHLLGR